MNDAEKLFGSVLYNSPLTERIILENRTLKDVHGIIQNALSPTQAAMDLGTDIPRLRNLLTNCKPNGIPLSYEQLEELTEKEAEDLFTNEVYNSPLKSLFTNAAAEKIVTKQVNTENSHMPKAFSPAEFMENLENRFLGNHNTVISLEDEKHMDATEAEILRSFEVPQTEENMSQKQHLENNDDPWIPNKKQRTGLTSSSQPPLFSSYGFNFFSKTPNEKNETIAANYFLKR